MYDLLHSMMKRAEKIAAVDQGAKQENASENKLYLFFTKICPNCCVAKEALKGTDYILEDAEEAPELTESYGVMQAPTLVQVLDRRVKQIVNTLNVRKFTVNGKKNIPYRTYSSPVSQEHELANA